MEGFMMDLTKIQDKIPEILPLAEEDTSANKIYFACLLHINSKPENYRLLKNRKV